MNIITLLIKLLLFLFGGFLGIVVVYRYVIPKKIGKIPSWIDILIVYTLFSISSTTTLVKLGLLT